MSSYNNQIIPNLSLHSPTIRPFSAAQSSRLRAVLLINFLYGISSNKWCAATFGDMFSFFQMKVRTFCKDSLFSYLLKSMEETTKFKTIFVFCGNSSGNKASYQDAALHLATELVARRIDLVYGGRSVGLMGIVAQAVQHGGCNVTRIASQSLMPDEIIGGTFKEVTAVSYMHQRKTSMSRQADAFIALPGGYGTLEELMEVITWSQLGIHHKPVGLLNVDGYYNSLLTFIDKAVDEGFVSPSARRIIISASTAKELFQELEKYVPEYDEVTSKLVWEEVDRLNYFPEPCCNT